MNAMARKSTGRTLARPSVPAKSSGELIVPDVAGLATDLGRMIEAARASTVQAVNAALTALHWSIGERLSKHVLDGKRAGYGDQIVSTVGRLLEASYGRGFGEKSLRHMLRFVEAFPDHAIVSTAWRQLSWSHLKRLSYIEDPLKRAFYLEMCRVESWSVRTFVQKLDSMLYERTALSKKPEALIRTELDALRRTDAITPSIVLQDPYLLDFLDLRGAYSEHDLESALLREIERFLLELGAGFAFVERQKRITLDGDDHYIDLLFYHRRLQRLIAIELKIGDFKAADSGQIELYLRWLDRHERQPHEQAPLGIILCAGKKRETVEYLDLGARGIHVAEYLTELPPREVLEAKLHAAIAAAREHLSRVEAPAPKALPTGEASRTPRAKRRSGRAR